MEWLWKKLGLVPREDMTGLEIVFPGCWVIEAAQWDAARSFAALPVLVDDDCTLFLEGGSHSGEIANYIETHRVETDVRIARGTIWPRQKVCHLPATEEIFYELSKLAEYHAVPEICDHLVIYRPTMVLVDWYDVFDREIYASSTIPESSVHEFAELVDAKYRVEVS